MATFQKVKLGDLLNRGLILSIQDGNHGELHPSAKDYIANGEKIPFVMANNISGNKIDLDTCKFIPKTLADKLRIGFAKEGDVVLTHKGTVGEVATVHKSEYPYIMLTPQVTYYRVDDTKLNSKFLSCYFRSPNFQSQLKNFNAQSTRAYVGITAQKQLEVVLPDIPAQTRIASVLSAYDDLIENNEKRIKALEEMAQLLYAEWFVKFKFPGHEQVKLIDSGTEYGKIPEGWEVVTIGSLLSSVKRKTKTQTDEYLLNGRYPIVDQGREFIAGYTNDERTVFDQDLVVFGDHSRCFKYCNFPFACGADGTQLLLTNDSERMPEVLLYYVSINSGLQNYNYARHFKFLKSLQVIKPDTLSAKWFKDVVKEAYIQIRVLRDKNLILSKTRDLLIPQLVTGKRELK